MLAEEELSLATNFPFRTLEEILKQKYYSIKTFNTKWKKLESNKGPKLLFVRCSRDLLLVGLLKLSDDSFAWFLFKLKARKLKHRFCLTVGQVPLRVLEVLPAVFLQMAVSTTRRLTLFERLIACLPGWFYTSPIRGGILVFQRKYPSAQALSWI